MVLRTGQVAVVEPEWLPDDTEEDLVGSSLHQLAINSARMYGRNASLDDTSSRGRPGPTGGGRARPWGSR